MNLSNGEHLDLYDTSGPYTDDSPDAPPIDLLAGLPQPRHAWTRPAPAEGVSTQLAWAKAGIVTDEMRFVAAREGVDVELVRSEVARGRAVIPRTGTTPRSSR